MKKIISILLSATILITAISAGFIVFAAEEARRTGTVIDVDEYNAKMLGKDFEF